MNKTYLSVAIAAVFALSACGGSSNNVNVTPAVVPGNVLLDSNRIAFMDFASPANSLTTIGAVTGLTLGDTLVSIDRRPQNGFLYGLGYNSVADTVTLYVIHPETKVATSLGFAGGFTTDGINPAQIGNSSTRFEIDFNTAVDRIRVINSLGKNFRMNPNTGTVVDGNNGLVAPATLPAGTNMDGALNGTSVTAQGTAYVNNVANNGGITTQYTIDENSDNLFIQSPPNEGTLSDPKELTPRISSVLGFDIAPGVSVTANNNPVTTGSGYLLMRSGANTAESLATVNLVTGAISNITAIAGGATARGIAVQNPESNAAIALSSDGTQLVRFAISKPATTTTTVVITGVTMGESLVGIDFRPATGQLFALGVNPTADNGTVYLIDPQNGAASAIGTQGSIAFVDAMGAPVDLPDPTIETYGFDFNPSVDRIRITTSTGLNLRLNQVTGTPVDGDPVAAGANPDGGIKGSNVTGASGAAYTNSVASAPGMGTTSLYILSNTGSQLTIQNPPNEGTQTLPLTVRLNGSTLAYTRVNGFDIPSDVRVAANNAAVTNGSGLAALTVGGTTSLYRINLATGSATNLGAIGTGMATYRGLALGQTHAR
jgi:hypothetical protein|tara:strand:- start:13850 stop:15652 length:1803 start_codon:yes stop_codon:yes gene_type:complete